MKNKNKQTLVNTLVECLTTLYKALGSIPCTGRDGKEKGEEEGRGKREKKNEKGKRRKKRWGVSEEKRGKINENRGNKEEGGEEGAGSREMKKKKEGMEEAVAAFLTQTFFLISLSSGLHYTSRCLFSLQTVHFFTFSCSACFSLL